MLYAQKVELSKNVVYPLKPLSSQATRSHPGKTRNYKPKALKETMLNMRRKKRVSLFHTPSTGQHLFPHPIKPKRKNGDMRKIKETYTGSYKKEKTGGKLKESKLVKLN